jgi:Flp pilus assembly pilin Flp
MSNLLIKLLLAANTRTSLRSDEGQTVTEYAIVVGLIVVGAIAVLSTIGKSVLANLQDLADALK